MRRWLIYRMTSQPGNAVEKWEENNVNCHIMDIGSSSIKTVCIKQKAIWRMDSPLCVHQLGVWAMNSVIQTAMKQSWCFNEPADTVRSNLYQITPIIIPCHQRHLRLISVCCCFRNQINDKQLMKCDLMNKKGTVAPALLCKRDYTNTKTRQICVLSRWLNTCKHRWQYTWLLTTSDSGA